MSVIATDVSRFSALIKFAPFLSEGYHVEVVTANEATAKTYALGQTLGKVTSGGKYKIATQAAVDGSQNVAGIFIGDVLGSTLPLSVAGTTDTKVLVLVRGPAQIAQGALVWDASFTTQGQKDTAFAGMEAAGVLRVTTL